MLHVSAFTNNKAIHSLEVANFMRNRAEALGLNSEHAWLIGYIHDIGYIYGGPNHNQLGYAIMAPFSKDLANYIYLHDSKDEIKSHMEFLLRLADFVIDETGKYVGMAERKNSILRRDINVDIKNLEDSINAIEEYAAKHNLIHIIEYCR